MGDRPSDGAVPFEAEVAVTGSHWNSRDHRGLHARTVHIQLLPAESVGDSPIDLYDLRAEDVAVEPVRTFEIAHRDDDVVQSHGGTIRDEWVAESTLGIVGSRNAFSGNDEGGISMVVTSVISTDLALALVRVVVGLVIAAHGAQKVLGVWGGPGLAGWTQGVTRMGLRLPVFWAWVSAFAELAGGIAFAFGFLLPVVAAALTIQMGVAIARAHWGKGFWNSKGGIEFPFTLGAIALINGLSDPGRYSLDRALGLPALGAGVYVVVLVVGTVAYLVSSGAVGAERAKVNRAA